MTIMPPYRIAPSMTSSLDFTLLVVIRPTWLQKRVKMSILLVFHEATGFLGIKRYSGTTFI